MARPKPEHVRWGLARSPARGAYDGGVADTRTVYPPAVYDEDDGGCGASIRHVQVLFAAALALASAPLNEQRAALVVDPLDARLQSHGLDRPLMRLAEEVPQGALRITFDRLTRARRGEEGLHYCCRSVGSEVAVLGTVSIENPKRR